MSRCQFCNGVPVSDPHRGEVYCEDCGMVLVEGMFEPPLIKEGLDGTCMDSSGRVYTPILPGQSTDGFAIKNWRGGIGRLNEDRERSLKHLSSAAAYNRRTLSASDKRKIEERRALKRCSCADHRNMLATAFKSSASKPISVPVIEQGVQYAFTRSTFNEIEGSPAAFNRLLDAGCLVSIDVDPFTLLRDLFSRVGASNRDALATAERILDRVRPPSPGDERSFVACVAAFAATIEGDTSLRTSVLKYASSPSHARTIMKYIDQAVHLKGESR